MKILGLGYGGFHDSNIAVMEDEKVIYAINEERLSGVKKDGRFPSKSLEAIDLKDIKVLCVANLRDEEFNIENQKAFIKPSANILDIRKKVFESIDSLAKSFDEVHFYSHQDCHAASAFFFSGFKKALIVTWDAGSISEPWNFTVQIGDQNKINRIEESTNGLPALNYSAITAILGFRPERHEGKITGLAAHGKLIQSELHRVVNFLKSFGDEHNVLEKITVWNNAGSKTEIPELEVIKEEVEKIFIDLNISKENLATIIQHLAEEQVINKVKELIVKFPEQENICLAGGLFANVIINKKIKELGFRNIYIHPGMGDEGLSLGACALYLSSKDIVPTYSDTVFWGSNYKSENIESMIKESGLKYNRPDNFEFDIARKLSENKIVARFNGSMEYGPRSLGNRSILASATNKEMNDSLNKKLRRTEFMPFAPITLEDDKNVFYKNIIGMDKALKFMTIAVNCTDKCKNDYPAIVHIDNTARPQIVGDENSGLKKILIEYKKITGLSTLINTSFNMHEGPIVCSPQNAIDTFKESKLDFLAIEGYIVEQN